MASGTSGNDKMDGKNVNKLDKLTEKERVAGIVYLSRIPPCMSVKNVRQMLGVHGEIGRIFLQPDDKATGKKKNRMFSEGWVEFSSKKVAKQVAATLNSTQVGGKRRSPWYEEIWNMRYLHRFKWEHLNERLAYERAVHQQRLRTEISQVKKESNFYIQNVEKNEKVKQLVKKGKLDIEKKEGDRDWSFQQKDTDSEKMKKRKADEKTGTSKRKKLDDCRKASVDKSFLQSIFSGGVRENDDI